MLQYEETIFLLQKKNKYKFNIIFLWNKKTFSNLKFIFMLWIKKSLDFILKWRLGADYFFFKDDRIFLMKKASRVRQPFYNPVLINISQEKVWPVLNDVLFPR